MLSRPTICWLCPPPPKAWSFLSHLPVLEVGLSVKGWWEDNQEQSERPLPAAGANLLEESSWLDVHADQEYVLQVSLRRITLGQQRVSSFFFSKSPLCSIVDTRRQSQRNRSRSFVVMSKCNNTGRKLFLFPKLEWEPRCEPMTHWVIEWD